MDADTRHQLKSNELADMLASLKDLKKPQYLYPGLVVLVVAVAVAAWYGWRYSQRVAAEQDWQRLDRIIATLNSGDVNTVSGAQGELRAMLDEKLPPSVLGYARVELARSRVEQGLAQPTERPGAFEDAAKLLEAVRSDPATPPMQQAEATFLLASTCESLRQLDRAKELYQSLTQEAQYAGSPYQSLAERRLSDIDKLAKPVAFVPGEMPVAPPPEVMGPPAEPTTRPITLTPILTPAQPVPAQELPQPESPQPLLPSTESPHPPNAPVEPPPAQAEPVIPPSVRPPPAPQPPPPPNPTPPTPNPTP
jgi:hypothetical protein